MAQRKHKISLKLLLTSVCLILNLAVALLFIFYFKEQVSSRLEDQARQAADFFLQQIDARAERTFKRLRASVYFLTRDNKTRSIMGGASPSDAYVHSHLEEQLGRVFLFQEQFQEQIVTGIYLIDRQDSIYAIGPGRLNRDKKKEILVIAGQMKEVNAINSLSRPPEGDNCYTAVDYIDLSSMNPIGKIIFEINPEKLLKIPVEPAGFEGSRVLLLGPAGDLLSETTAGEPDLTAGGQATGSDPAAGGTDPAPAAAEKNYKIGKKLSTTALYAELQIPESSIYASRNEALQVFYLFFGILLFLFILTIVLISRLLYSPINEIVQKMNRVAGGDLDVVMTERSFVETRDISTSFNYMTKELKRLFKEVYEQGVLLKDAEFRSLEAQINPHFFFNVLELIHVRSMQAGAGGVAAMIVNLAEMLRMNIYQNKNHLITIRDELKYLNCYLALQKERFQDRLSYTIELEDPELLNCLIPKLTLQPIVENSLVHGLEKKPAGGFVRVGIWEEADGINIIVKDNGIGFNAAAWAAEPATKSTDLDSLYQGNHIALKNIQRRIELLYGDDFGLTIQSKPGEGTAVHLQIPHRYSQEGKAED